MHQGFLSDVELYYSDEINTGKSEISISGDEAHHALNVMRHAKDDVLFITDGKGAIYKSRIMEESRNNICLNIIETLKYKNEYEQIYFCIPRMKSQDRFEFAIEKCVELGITNFIVFESDRTIAKGDKKEKWTKLGISAMKQSIRPFKPEFLFYKSIDDIVKHNTDSRSKIYLLDQKAEKKYSKEIHEIKHSGMKALFIFGPEGGISERELYLLKECTFLHLTGNRLRSETAIIAAGILLTQ